MGKKSDWNPEQYLAYAGERTQPSIDLVSRINSVKPPALIADIGCGPGNSSLAIKQRWPDSELVGVDKSPAMIEKAKQDYPGQEWILSDVMNFTYNRKFDIVFSNAVIQWIPDHKNLFEKFFSLLSVGGIIAVQLPLFRDMELGMIISSVSRRSRWKKAMEGCAELFTYHDAGFYYDLLSEKLLKIDMWITDYIHVLPSHRGILDWIKTTGLKPYLDRLPDEQDRLSFGDEVLEDIKARYPLQADGKALLPFKRLFFIGYLQIP
ncbi:MAG: methyltransferase domain-containing protein [Spirochaetales bacterium]|nr:MAG: methyltransferase domain-containing protein [Spirochaetales bacterium]